MSKIVLFLLFTASCCFSQISITKKLDEFKINNNDYIELELTYHNDSEQIYYLYLQNWRIIKQNDITHITFGWPNYCVPGNRIWFYKELSKYSNRDPEDNGAGKIRNNCIKILYPKDTFSIVLLSKDSSFIRHLKDDGYQMYYYYSILKVDDFWSKNIQEKYPQIFYNGAKFIIPETVLDSTFSPKSYINKAYKNEIKFDDPDEIKKILGEFIPYEKKFR